MACLSNEQLEYIRIDLKKRSVSRSFLFNEWVDHVCCDVESMINKGMEFKDAYRHVLKDKSELEVKDAHSKVQQFLNHKYVTIKKILFAAFIIYAISWAINFRGSANWVGLASFLILTIVYFRIAADFFRERRVRGSNVLLSVFASFAAIGILTGILLLFLNWNFGIDTRGHSVDLTVFGWFFFSLLCLIYYINEWNSSIEKKEAPKLRLFILVSGINVLLATVSIATFPFYNVLNEYIFFLVGLILGFDVVVLTALLITRSMKNTLAVTMIVGSIMIVFIHAPFRHKLPGGSPKMYEYTLQYVPKTTGDAQTLYLYMAYKKFPGNPFVIPLGKRADGSYLISIPSFAFKDFIYYRIEKDSVDAMEYFRQAKKLDSLYITIPKQNIYNLDK